MNQMFYQRNEERGGAETDLLIFLVVILVLGLSWFGSAGRREADNGGKRLFVPPPINNLAPTSGARPGAAAGESKSIGAPSVDAIVINRGTASSAIQPGEEYIILEAPGRNRNPVTLTGWQLANARGGPFAAGSRLPNEAVIPLATRIFTGTGGDVLEPLVLAPGERAIVTTGRMPFLSPITVDKSFRVNKCSGYIENLPNYRFTPSLARQCPQPKDETGVLALDNDCYRFVSRLGSCRTPEFHDEGDKVGLVDSTRGLSTACRAFLKNHFSYQSCVVNHQADDDFLVGEWRVFLNLPWQLWAENREKITLYNPSGEAITSISY